MTDNNQIEENYDLYIKLMNTLNKGTGKKIEVPAANPNKDIETIADANNYHVYEDSDSKADIIIIARQGIQDDKNIASIVKDLLKTAITAKPFVVADGEGYRGTMTDVPPMEDDKGNQTYIVKSETFLDELEKYVGKKGNFIDLLFDDFQKYGARVIVSDRGESVQGARMLAELEIEDLREKRKECKNDCQKKAIDNRAKQRISDYVEELKKRAELHAHDLKKIIEEDKTLYITDFKDIALGVVTEILKEGDKSYIILAPD